MQGTNLPQEKCHCGIYHCINKPYTVYELQQETKKVEVATKFPLVWCRNPTSRQSPCEYRRDIRAPWRSYIVHEAGQFTLMHHSLTHPRGTTPCVHMCECALRVKKMVTALVFLLFHVTGVSGNAVGQDFSPVFEEYSSASFVHKNGYTVVEKSYVSQPFPLLPGQMLFTKVQRTPITMPTGRYAVLAFMGDIGKRDPKNSSAYIAAPLTEVYGICQCHRRLNWLLAP